MPERKDTAEAWFDGLLPIRLGKVDSKRPQLTNSSCRLISTTKDLKPGDSIVHQFKMFAGPKKAAVLQNKEYHLGEVLYFGWPVFAIPAMILTWLLHAFYAIVQNYGLAILMLTAVVRLGMFPLSRKQVISQQKMQALQPEIKRLQEKYKNNVEGRNKAQQELFRKHNYNPLSGCLPIFIQMPIFIGLYKALQSAIELRDAPLFSPSIRWCSNLAAPDMLFNWSSFMPTFVTEGPGFLFLGPYFNLLPILTIGLFIAQQKMFMPPAADEQAATQQKIMQYMMILMGLLFYKVGSGLCLYFIASSVWGMVERRYMPKAAPVAAGDVETRAQVKARARQEAEAAAKGKKNGK
jgi:YidC/Oxa1 family membrane protein insertase